MQVLNTFWVTTRWALLPTVLSIIGTATFLPDAYWESELFHVIVEGGGSLIGFGLAVVVWGMIQKQQLSNNYIWLIACFVSMGILDLFHSQHHPGQEFVWLHSAATLVGGFFALLIWTPSALSGKFIRMRNFWLLVVSSIGFSIAFTIWPDLTPAMLNQDGQFTFVAKALNVVGGIGFLGAWLYFAVEYHRLHHPQSFYFSNHFCLFALAGFVFEISVLWDANWWFWHMMRAFAYVFLMAHFLAVYRKKIDDANKQELQEQRVLADTIFDAAGNVIVVLDTHGSIVRFNTAAEELTGYKAQELLGQPIWDYLIPEEQMKGVKGVFENLRKGEVNIASQYENEWVTREKERRLLQWHNTVLWDAEGGVSHIIALGYDITDKKQSELESARLQKELQQAQKMESLGQLTGGIAHDFNNLLAIINGFSELSVARSKQNGDSKLEGYLGNIKDAGIRASELVSQMLMFSRADESIDKPLKLSPLVKEDIKMLRASLPSSIDIESNIEAELPSVVINPTKLHQILMNLSVNARDAMKGAGKLTVSLRMVGDIKAYSSVTHKPIKGDWIELSVSDTGTGIAPNVIDNIFNPFFTTKEVGEGTGMGLSVIYRIMENSNGHIIVDSKQGEGSVFRLLFPPIHNESDASQESTLHVSEIPKGNGSEILVVDDEPALTLHMSELLKANDYEVTSVNDSEEAWRIFQDFPERFSMLITDQTMPKMTGIELINKIRNLQPELPTIMCSGYSDKVDAAEASKFNISYFQKPVDINKLLIRVAALLETRG